LVLKGQFLERPTLIPVGKWVLEGLSHRGERQPPLLIVPPLPEEGGAMDHVVAAELAWAVTHAGHPTLRFNFRGVGASQGERGGGAERLADARAAVAVLRENTGAKEIAVASIGGAARTLLDLQAVVPAVRAAIFVGAGALDPKAWSELRVSALAVAAEKDPHAARRGWSAALVEAGGEVAWIDQADPAFTRNLPEVGKAVVRFLGQNPRFH
jgi:alpha/beta superfamily hydrolase